MTLLTYIIWFAAFVGGVIGVFFVPEDVLSLSGKFCFLGAWGAVLGFVLFTICRKRIETAEANYTENLNTFKASQLNLSTEGSLGEITSTVNDPIAVAEANVNPLPKGAVSAKEALENMIGESEKICFPLAAWRDYSRCLLKDRPFAEAVKALETLLPQMFPKSSGILYMYADTQAELHKIVAFGDKVVGDDVIRPGECASYDAGDIVVTDYSNSNLSSGCTHLHNPKGISFCAPVEGLDEHFGIFTLLVESLPDNESVDDWHAKVSFVATTFGLYVANKNLNERFKQHSIRDILTGLFNRRYMEESLVREVSAAARHSSPIGLIMLYPDAMDSVMQNGGRHAAEQLLWELGQRLPGYIRTEDIPCRFDGNVFCVIMPGADLNCTRQRAEKIRNEISQLQVAYGDSILATTLSMGISVMPNHASDAQTLLSSAEACMQFALQVGGNRVILADALNQQ